MTGISNSVSAVRLPNHRKHYLDYDGPLSEGRGTVSRELDGECEWLEATATRVRVRLSSGVGHCELRLEKVHGDTWRAETC
ncbi:MAG: hypothetical protein ACR2NU_02540 [Aeoliella sp.]